MIDSYKFRWYLKARSALFFQYVSLSGSATWKLLSKLYCFRWRINASLCIWVENVINDHDPTFSSHFATIVGYPHYGIDVLLGEVHPVLLAQGLVLLDGDSSVPAQVKLLKNIVKCCVNIKSVGKRLQWPRKMNTLPLCSLCSFFILPTVWYPALPAITEQSGRAWFSRDRTGHKIFQLRFCRCRVTLISLWVESICFFVSKSEQMKPFYTYLTLFLHTRSINNGRVKA